MNRAVPRFLLPVLILAAPVLAAGEETPPWSQATWGEVGLLDSADRSEIGITAVAASSDSKLLATAHAGGAVRLWNSTTGIELAVLRQHRGDIAALALIDAGKTLLCASEREIVAWDTVSGTRQKTLALQAGTFAHAVLTPDARTLVAATSSGRVLLINTSTAAATPLDRPVRAVVALAAAPDGKVVACADESGSVVVCNLQTRRIEARFVPDEAHLPRAMTFSPDGRLIAVSLGRSGVLVWDRDTNQRRVHFRPSPLNACALAFSPDSRGLALGTASGSILMFDLVAEQTGPPLRGHAGQIQHMLFLPGQQLVTAGTDTVARLWRGYLPGQPEIKLPEPDLSEREVRTLVNDLSSSESDQAERAVRALLFMPNQSVALLRKLIKPVPPADPKRFSQLLAELDSRSYPVRRKAFDELQRMGESAKELIRQALVSPANLETSSRLQLLGERLDNPDSFADMRLSLRGVQVLARINSPEARRHLGELSKGVPGAHLTRAAEVALARGK